MSEREPIAKPGSQNGVENEPAPSSIRSQELLDALLAEDSGEAGLSLPTLHQPYVPATLRPPSFVNTQQNGPVSIGRPPNLVRPAPSTDDEIDALLEAALPMVEPSAAPVSLEPSTQEVRTLSPSQAELLNSSELEAPRASEPPEYASWAPDSFVEEALTLRRTSKPPPLPRSAPRPLDAERPASAHIEEAGAVEQWAERAAWLEQQAELTTDPKARARLLIVASEVWAMVGDPARGQKLAGLGNTACPASPIASRQNRWFSAERHDWKDVAAALDVEMRASADPEARAHAAYYSAEIQRLLLSDHSLSQKKLEFFNKLKPADARGLVMSFLDALRAKQAPATNWPNEGGLSELANATDHMLHARGDSDTAVMHHVPMSVAFQKASRALCAGRPEQVATNLEPIAQSKGLKGATLWLRATLLSHRADTREKATDHLNALAERKRTALVVRSLVHRALENSDFERVRQILSEPTQAESLSVAERTALVALAPLGLETDNGLRTQALATPALLPLVAAIDAARPNANANAKVFSGDGAAVWQANMAHALADASTSGATENLQTLRDALLFPGAPPNAAQLIQALQLELFFAESNLQSLADQIRSCPKDPPDATTLLLVAAILYEARGLPNEAQICYAECLRNDAANEGLARALLDTSDPSSGTQYLMGVADATSDGTHRALLLTEAALRLGQEHRDYRKTLKEAFEADPELPFAQELRQRDARVRGHDQDLLELLSETRNHRTGPREQASLLLAEAWMLSGQAPQSSATLLREASELAGKDLATALFLGRWGDPALSAQALQSDHLANELPAEQTHGLKFSAALFHATLGNSEECVACLEQVFPGDPLTQSISEQNDRAGRGLDRYLESSKAILESGNPSLRQSTRSLRASLLENRGRSEDALLEYRALLEDQPTHLQALYHVRQSASARGDFAELARLSGELSSLLTGDLALSNAWLATHLSVLEGHPELSQGSAERALKSAAQPLWAQRRFYAHTGARDAGQSLRFAQSLAQRAENPLDRATLSLRAAEAAMALERYPEALSLIDAGLLAVSDHFVLLIRKADLLERLGEYPQAAEVWERLGGSCNSPEQEHRAWRRAAMVWQDHVDNKPRAILALSHALNLDPHDDDTFARLLALYRESGQLEPIVELLEQRLAFTHDIEARIALDVERCRTLVELGLHARARAGLSLVLELAPNQPEALSAYAELSVAASDFTAAEQAWLRVVRQLPDPLAQAAIYLKLGGLYEVELPNPERAEVAFNEVLKRIPEDVHATSGLARVYGKLGQTERALKLATQILEQALSENDKQRCTLSLAELQEHSALDLRKAQATLERARRQWPQDPDILAALVTFYQRTSQSEHSDKALKSVMLEVRRAVSSGRFDRGFFLLLARAAELKKDPALREATEAALAAIEGRPGNLRGVGLGALDSAFDDLLAPEIFTADFRAFLLQTHQLLELAFPVDPNTLRALPFAAADSALEAEIFELSAELGLPTPKLLISPILGAICVPTLSPGPELIFGKAVADASPSTRTFLITRSLKLLMSHTAALTRIAAIELSPILAGLLSTFDDRIQVASVEPSKIAAVRARIQPHVTTIAPDLPRLAASVAQTLGDRANQLGLLTHQWANRSALLAYGDLNAALQAIALSSGQHAFGELDREARVRFLMRHNEARELVVFSLSDDYTLARSRL